MADSSSLDHISPEAALSPTNSYILVVDDEPANLSLLKEALSVIGLKIRVVTSGLKAIEVVKKNHPSIILLDVSMPGIDGFETCKRLKSDPETADIPIVFATAFSEVEQKVKGFSLGAVDYITKPFHVEEVLARVKVQLALQTLTTHLRDKNKALEQEVQARVLAEKNLTALNQTLQENLEKLQKIQIELIQSEKMSSLGQMMAGIAHELNNPVGFIHGNIQYLQQYFLDLSKLVDQYTTDYPVDNEAIAALKQQFDLDFIRTDLPKVISSVSAGTNRIQNILESMHVYSRLNESNRKDVDIEKGIESVLLILNSRLKAQHNRSAIQVIKQYSELPPVDCYPRDLNQVFLHILTNSIDAFEETDRSTAQDLTITIQTVLEQDSVVITISDNGPGIPNDIQEKIFDPFFSTKLVGQGKGLGLSIAHQIIVQQHGGTLTLDSAPGQGTTFILLLPLQQPYPS